LKNISLLLLLVISVLLFTQCKTEPKVIPPPPVKNVVVPKFEKDSAYQYIARQVAFGPRVPNTAAHQAAKKLESQSTRQRIRC